MQRQVRGVRLQTAPNMSGPDSGVSRLREHRLALARRRRDPQDVSRHAAKIEMNVLRRLGDRRKPTLVAVLFLWISAVVEAWLVTESHSVTGATALLVLGAIPAGFLLLYLFGGSVKAWFGRTIGSIFYNVTFLAGLGGAAAALLAAPTAPGVVAELSAVGLGGGVALAAQHIWRRDYHTTERDTELGSHGGRHVG